MSAPDYCDRVFDHFDVQTLIDEVPWEQRTSARQECFMSDPPGLTYSYGSERASRTYVSVVEHPIVRRIREVIGWPNACFLNRYDDDHKALGWHADDFDGMDHTHPVVVVSFGQEREIWWRENGQTGIVPAENRRLLRHGSVFIMPPGFQQTHQHRIPRGDRRMEPRVSLTFRRFRGHQ